MLTKVLIACFTNPFSNLRLDLQLLHR